MNVLELRMPIPHFSIVKFNSVPSSDVFCRLLITFANSLDPDQAQQNVGLDLEPNCLTLWYSGKVLLEMLILKKSTNEKKHANLHSMQKVVKSGF